MHHIAEFVAVLDVAYSQEPPSVCRSAFRFIPDESRVLVENPVGEPMLLIQQTQFVAFCALFV